MKALETIGKLLAKLPPDAITLLVGFVRDLVRTGDPKAVLTRARKIAAAKIAFREAQVARRPKAKR